MTRNLKDFYEAFFSSSLQEKKGLAVLSQYLQQGCFEDKADDSLAAQLIQKECQNLNDLR